MAIADLYGKLLAMGSMVIRKATVMSMLVNRTSAEDPSSSKTLGGNVEVIVPPTFTSRAVVPAATPPVSQGQPAPTTVQVPLEYWQEVNFNLTERDINLLSNNDAYVPMFLANAASAIADDIATSLLAQYKGIYGYVGVAGTTPFGTSTLEAQNAKLILTNQRCPKQMRNLVLDTTAYANATGLPAFQSAFNSGTTDTIVEGEIGRKLGFNWYEDQNVQTHISTPLTAGAATINGTFAIGATTVNIAKATNASPLVQGDIISFAGDAQTYVVTANVTLVAGTTNVTIQPPLRVAKVGGEAMSLRASHTVSLAFNPMAFAFASRPNAQLNLPELRTGKVVGTFVDDMTGVVLKLVIQDEYHQTGFYLSCLWGAKLVDPRLAARVAG